MPTLRFKSIMMLQFLGVVLLSAASAAVLASALSTAHRDVDGIDESQARLFGSTHEFVRRVRRFIVDARPPDHVLADRALTAARGGLDAFVFQWPAATSEVRAAAAALEASEQAWFRIVAATGTAERAREETSFDTLTTEVYAGLGAVGDAARQSTWAALWQGMVLFLSLWAATFAWFLGTAAWARRVHHSSVAADVASIRISLTKLYEAQHRAQPDQPRRVVPDQPSLPMIAQCVTETADALMALQVTLQQERTRSAFGANLMDALDLADDEAAAMRITDRAVAEAFPSCGVQVLLADNSMSVLEPALTTRPSACEASTPQSCPAVRKGRILQHSPGGGLTRCARLTESACFVTCAPITAAGRAIGALQLAGPALDARNLDQVGTLCVALGARLSVVRTLSEREIQARTDVLTGLQNRRAMHELLTKLDREGTPYALIAADLDHFKRLNDTYGHEVGDRCLRVFAQVLRDSSRSSDAPCRPGGEEFTLVLPNTTGPQATAVAERIRFLLADASRRSGVAFTTSLGVAARPSNGDAADELLRIADRALYEAKAAGRDRVVMAAGKPAAPEDEATDDEAAGGSEPASPAGPIVLN